MAKCGLFWCEDDSDPNGGIFCEWHCRALSDLRKRYDAYMYADHHGNVEPLDELEADTQRLILSALDVGIASRSYNNGATRIGPLQSVLRSRDEAHALSNSKIGLPGKSKSETGG